LKTEGLFNLNLYDLLIRLLLQTHYTRISVAKLFLS